MAVICTTDVLSMSRGQAHTPGNVGDANPRTSTEATVRPPKTKPSIIIRPRCIPRPYVYPKYLALPVGPNERGRYHLLRYSCLRTTIRWIKIYRAIKQEPVYHNFPLDFMPFALMDRNPYPVSGRSPKALGKMVGIRSKVS